MCLYGCETPPRAHKYVQGVCTLRPSRTQVSVHFERVFEFTLVSSL